MNEHSQLAFEENILTIHQLTLSKIPGKAALGRALKAMYEPFITHLKNEVDRGSARSDMAYGTSKAMGVLLGSMLRADGLRLDDNGKLILEVCLETIRTGIHVAFSPETDEKDSPDEHPQGRDPFRRT